MRIDCPTFLLRITYTRRLCITTDICIGQECSNCQFMVPTNTKSGRESHCDAEFFRNNGRLEDGTKPQVRYCFRHLKWKSTKLDEGEIL